MGAASLAGGRRLDGASIAGMHVEPIDGRQREQPAAALRPQGQF
jgi:hypothetical protein